MLRPELSNLQIWTAALGLRLFRASSVEVVYHRYRQVEAADALRDARIKADPRGERRTIGQEWNPILGIEEWEPLEIELVGAVFRAGSAFGDLEGELAYTVEFKLDINF